MTRKLDSCSGTEGTTQKHGRLFPKIIDMKLAAFFRPRLGDASRQAKPLSCFFCRGRFTNDRPQGNASLRKLVAQIDQLIDMQDLTCDIQRQARTLKKTR